MFLLVYYFIHLKNLRFKFDQVLSSVRTNFQVNLEKEHSACIKRGKLTSVFNYIYIYIAFSVLPEIYSWVQYKEMKKICWSIW